MISGESVRLENLINITISGSDGSTEGKRQFKKAEFKSGETAGALF